MAELAINLICNEVWNVRYFTLGANQRLRGLWNSLSSFKSGVRNSGNIESQINFLWILKGQNLKVFTPTKDISRKKARLVLARWVIF